MKPSLLIIEDDEDIRSQLNWALVNDYELALAGDRPSALALFREVVGRPDFPADALERIGGFSRRRRQSA